MISNFIKTICQYLFHFSCRRFSFATNSLITGINTLWNNLLFTSLHVVVVSGAEVQLEGGENDEKWHKRGEREARHEATTELHDVRPGLCSLGMIAQRIHVEQHVCGWSEYAGASIVLECHLHFRTPGGHSSAKYNLRKYMMLTSHSHGRSAQPP